MTQPSQTWTSQSDSNSSSSYHPHCGAEHNHKPAKAMIGIGLLVVLSFVLYELKTPDHRPSSDNGAQHQTVARR